MSAHVVRCSTQTQAEQAAEPRTCPLQPWSAACIRTKCVDYCILRATALLCLQYAHHGNDKIPIAKGVHLESPITDSGTMRDASKVRDITHQYKHL